MNSQENIENLKIFQLEEELKKLQIENNQYSIDLEKLTTENHS